MMPNAKRTRALTIAVLIAFAMASLALPVAAQDADPLGLLTPDGVPVAITRSTHSGYWVTTPCGYQAHLGEGTPIYETTVVIDPGHGGMVDTGAVAPTGMPEKVLNLNVAYQVIDALTRRGIDAILTRTDDYASPLSVRANLADTLGAEIMVSIHHNSPSPGPSREPGIEVFVQQESDLSGRLGGLLFEHAMAGLGSFNVNWVGAADAGVMTVLSTRGDDAYGIIRHPDTPTALIELGYLSNRSEAALHQTPEYLSVAGEAIADAIEDYLNTDESGSGFVRGRVFNPQPGVGRDVCVDPPLPTESPSIWSVLPWSVLPPGLPKPE
ncbi:MAG: N-acetylmuramoyl-L-alanine amidase [Actinomycetota bacterium]|nr:N-acetylmuramoyl-L-alanine amidase [Actinomycetota bacterium]